MRTYIRFLAWVTGILGGLGLFLYFAMFDVWTVPGDDPQFALSIQPTMKSGDTVLVYRHSSPGWGNLVRCPDPDAPGRWVVGRIVGVSNDHVQVTHETVSVNSRQQNTVGACNPQKIMVTDPATKEDVELTCSRREFAEMETATLRGASGFESDLSVTVEPGKVYLLSDDMHFHQDSREFGQVNPKDCQHIVYRLSGADGFGDSERRLNILW